MDLGTAMLVLGLPWNFTSQDVLRAFKKCILEAHPDKNPDPGSHERTQQIYEARDFLTRGREFSQYERQEARRCMEEREVARDVKKVRDWMGEVEYAAEEAKEAFQAWYKARDKFYAGIQTISRFLRWFEVGCEYAEKLKAIQRRKRYNATLKRKRKEGTRAHRKTADYQEGKVMSAQIDRFLQENIMSSCGSRLSASDIRKRFRDTHQGLSALELRLFQRHYKTLLLRQFPDAWHCKFKLQHSFKNVALK